MPIDRERFARLAARIPMQRRGDRNGIHYSIFGNFELYITQMIVIGTDIVESYFRSRAGHRGMKAARAQYEAWRAIAEAANWKTKEVKKAHPKASILKGGRVVFNIKANDFRLIALRRDCQCRRDNRPGSVSLHCRADVSVAHLPVLSILTRMHIVRAFLGLVAAWNRL